MRQTQGDREREIRGSARFLLPLAGLVLLSACGARNHTVTVGDLKSRYQCIEITEGLEWKMIHDAFKVPDEAPRPGPASLTENVRAYHEKTVIFHTGLTERQVEGKKVFIEVVTGVEICTCK